MDICLLQPLSFRHKTYEWSSFKINNKGKRATSIMLIYEIDVLCWFANFKQISCLFANINDSEYGFVYCNVSLQNILTSN